MYDTECEYYKGDRELKQGCVILSEPPLMKKSGHSIITGRKSRIEIEYSDGTVTRIGSMSIIALCPEPDPGWHLFARRCSSICTSVTG